MPGGDLNSTRRIPTLGRLEALLFLAGAGYLGFWIYGLVMGVFSLGELIPFTVLAVVIMVGTVARALYTYRVGQGGHDQPEELQRASRHQREVRGY